MNIFKIHKEERWVALIALLFLFCLNWLLISNYPDSFTKGGHLGYWSIFSKNFRMSGYDCWSYVMLASDCTESIGINDCGLWSCCIISMPNSFRDMIYSYNSYSVISIYSYF